jgi:hypothetical protein
MPPHGGLPQSLGETRRAAQPSPPHLISTRTVSTGNLSGGGFA